jgi:hypothetical protein
MGDPNEKHEILGDGTGFMSSRGSKGLHTLHGFNPDGRLIVSKADEIQRWNLETGTCEANLKGNGHSTAWTQLSEDGARFFVYAHHHDSIRLHVWDLSTNRQLLELPNGNPPFWGRSRWDIEGNTFFVQQENGYRVFDGTPAKP